MSYISLYLANSRQLSVPVPGTGTQFPSCTEAFIVRGIMFETFTSRIKVSKLAEMFIQYNYNTDPFMKLSYARREAPRIFSSEAENIAKLI